MQKKVIFLQKNLHMSKKCCTFAPDLKITLLTIKIFKLWHGTYTWSKVRPQKATLILKCLAVSKQQNYLFQCYQN